MEKVESSNKEVICSGSFITLVRDENKISFKYKGEDFNFKLSFFRDENTSASRIDYHPDEGEKTLSINFYNFENGLGVGNTRPAIVAEDNERKIYASFIIYSLNETTKNVVYTFYGDK